MTGPENTTTHAAAMITVAAGQLQSPETMPRSARTTAGPDLTHKDPT